MVTGLAALCVAGTALCGPSAAAADKEDPATSGFAPVSESDWWYDAMQIPKAHEQVTGKGAKIGLLEDAWDSSVPELQGADLKRAESCGYMKSLDLRGKELAEHGTSMAALLVGNGKGTDHGRGIRGVAPDAEVTLFGKHDDPTITYSCVEDSFGRMLKMATRQGMDILNMSFNLGDDYYAGGIDYALDHGVALVASHPHAEVRGYPASAPGVVAVTPVGSDAKLGRNFKPSDETVIAAPGIEVGSGGIVDGRWRSDVWTDGSSDATAIVSGALALVKSKYPEATGNQLVQHLIHFTTDPKYDWNPTYGFGIISVPRMLSSSPMQWPDENPLLNGPKAAVRAYPMWASSKIDAPEGVNDKWARAERAEARADGDHGGSADEAGDQDEAAAGGFPGWGWAGIGVAAVLVVGGGAAVALNRK